MTTPTDEQAQKDQMAAREIYDSVRPTEGYNGEYHSQEDCERMILAAFAHERERAKGLVEALEMNAGNVHYPQKVLEALAAYRGGK